MSIRRAMNVGEGGGCVLRDMLSDLNAPSILVPL